MDEETVAFVEKARKKMAGMRKRLDDQQQLMTALAETVTELKRQLAALTERVDIKVTDHRVPAVAD